MKGIKSSPEKLAFMRKYYQDKLKNNPAYQEYRRKYQNRYNKRPRIRRQRSDLRDVRRQFIFKILGETCKKCNFSDKRALQMDHIHGRKGEKRIGNIDARWRFVRDNPEKAKEIYQILCANCNYIKREEMNEHFYHGLSPDY